MTPIGVFMVEHLLIARMMNLMEGRLGRIGPETRPDMVFIDGAIDFAKTCADACHHGKEETIFFEKLAIKNLLPEHKKLMDELVLEHIQTRKIVTNLEMAREDFMKGDSGAVGKILIICKSLWQIYPAHMEKEVRQIF
jgi:hemerythrin-like domain-containing protein